MEGKMVALYKMKPGPGATLVEDADIPRIGKRDVLVKVLATSICGTDRHIYKWNQWAESRIHPPQIMGHEFAGEVVEVGEDVEGIQVGDYVSAETHIVCGHCPECLTGKYHVCRNTKILGVDRDGAFAQYIAIPASNAWKNPRSIPPDVASIQEPLGNAMHAVMTGDVSTKDVLIMGDGPISMMAAGISAAVGAGKILVAGHHEFRMDIAEKMGATHTFNTKHIDPVEETMNITDGEGVDVVLEMTGSQQGIDAALEVVKAGGVVVWFGVPGERRSVDVAKAVFKGVDIRSVVGRRMYETWFQVSNLLASGKLDVSPIITHVIPLSKYEEGFEALNRGEAAKVVMHPWE